MRKFVRLGFVLGCLVVSAAAWSDTSNQVKIDNFKFGPTQLTVGKGTAVTWTNQDDIPHSIIITALAAHSKVMDTDQAFTYQFDKAGTYSYMCGLHPFMHGEVVVK